MENIISGLVDRDGQIYKGSNFEVEKIDVGYEITFPTLNDPPTIVAQAWEIDDAITCVTVGFVPYSPVKVIIATLDKDGTFVPNAFTFIAVTDS